MKILWYYSKMNITSPSAAELPPAATWLPRSPAPAPANAPWPAPQPAMRRGLRGKIPRDDQHMGGFNGDLMVI